jgi:ATP-dependent Clp endopeptidase proteolytic subunit ClpP
MPEQPTAPLYRFHGRVPPKPGEKTAIYDAADVTVDAADGVATMRIYDPIDSWGGEWGVSAKEFAKALDALPDDTAEIRLHINSPGGEVYEGLAILNSLRNHKAKVTAVVDGLAASAASFIATGADEVVMGKNTQMMIHDAWGLCVGPAIDMRDMADRLDKISDNIASVYAMKTGGTKADWRSHMLAETWYDADEAVTAGLADRVEGEAPADAKNRFDLSVFQHAGREAAPEPPLPTSDDIAATVVEAPRRVEKSAAETADDAARVDRYMQRRVARRAA